MTYPTIIIAVDDLVTNQKNLEIMKYGAEEDKANAAETLLDSFVDDNDTVMECIVIKDVKLTLVCPESTSDTNALHDVLNELNIEHYSEY